MSAASSSSVSTFREVLPKKGLLFTESQAQLVVCKPKLLPLKSVTLQKMESMQKEAKLKAQQQLREEEQEEARAKDRAKNDPTFQSESVSFE